MSASRFFGWCLLALGPTIVGLCLSWLTSSSQDESAVASVFGLWLCGNVFCCLVAGVWLFDRLQTATFWKLLLGFLVALLLAALNIVLTLFAGCALVR